MNGPRCMVCGRPIRLARQSEDRIVWVHVVQPPPSPHTAQHGAMPFTIP